MIRLAVFGQPIAQSLSPKIHGLFAQQFGIDVDYRAIEATPETFAGLVNELAKRGGLGCNVTVPFKNAAFRLAERHGEDASRAQSANTLLFEKDGWRAESTDGGGLVSDLASLGFSFAGSTVCLLGAGGAAAGVLAALLRQNPGRVVIANRTLERAEKLSASHADLGPVSSCKPDEIAKTGPFDLVINATSLGHGGGAPAVNTGWFKHDALCYDMNYGAAAQPLKRACERAGINYSDGLGMLVGQAALSFELWTGRKPDTQPVLDQLRLPPGE